MKTAAHRTVALAAWAALLAAAAPTAPVTSAGGADLDTTLREVLAYRHGRPRQALARLESMVQAAAGLGADAPGSETRGALSRKIAAALGAEGAPEAKAHLLKQLAVVGGATEVPAVAPLLRDEALSYMARYALERIPGPAPARALREALPAVVGSLKAGVVSSLGTLRDAASVAALAGLLAASDGDLAQAAAGALGKIGGAEAARALSEALPRASGRLRAAVGEALLARAEALLAAGDAAGAAALEERLCAPGEPAAVRLGALVGLARSSPERALGRIGETIAEGGAPSVWAIAAARELAAGAGEAARDRLSKLPPAAQAAFVEALADLGRRDALPAVLEAARSPDGSVRLAALAALGRLGDASCAGLLAERLAKGEVPERDATRAALEALRGPGAGAAIAGLLAEAEPGLKAELVRVAAARRGADPAALLLAAATDPDGGVREAAWKGLREVAGEAQLPRLVGLLASLETGERGLAETAVAAAAQRAPKGRRAGAVLERLRSAKGPEAKRSLLRVLGALGDDEGLPGPREALADADAGVRDKAARVLCAWPAASAAPDVLAIAARDAAHRPAALEGLERMAPGLLDPALRGEIVTAMQRIIAAGGDAEVVRKADAVLREAAKPVNLARGATAESPDGLEPDGGSGPDAAAIDGNPDTYWDETDGRPLYRLVVKLPRPLDVGWIKVKGHAYRSHSPKDFEVLCDGRVVATVRDAEYDRATNEVALAFPPARAASIELRITGYYGGSPGIRELEIYSTAPPGAASAPAAAVGAAQAAAPAAARGGSALAWRRAEGSIALVSGEDPVWALAFPRGGLKPYFHPVALPGGPELTWLSPPDHPWHRGLWFAWKELNGVNYWEEDGPTGLSQGLTELLDAKVEPAADFSARIELALSYHPRELPAVLTEKRTLAVSAPGPDGGYRIDWSSVFTAGAEDVSLKGGTAGGGYAGLSVRAARATRDWRLLDSEGRRDEPSGGLAKSTHGQRARWMALSLTGADTGKAASIAVLDHPSNLRFPSQWHNVLDAAIPFGYFSPAPLWSEPYTLPAGKDLVLEYRILVRPGRLEREDVEREWKAFRSQGRREASR
ncbi:MAG: PmoA family protein [Planctomycetes bacterium]|nr:PmoA family protein [Planctomycetota bacterium]